MHRVLQLTLGIGLFACAMAGAHAAPINISFAASSSVPMTAGAISIDMIDGDGAVGSMALLSGMAVPPAAIEGAVQQTAPGQWRINDDLLLSSLRFDFADIGQGFSLVLDATLQTPGGTGFPDALVFTLLGTDGLALFGTGDPRGANAALVFSSYGTEIYAPDGWTIAVDGISAVPEPSPLALLLLALFGLAVLRRKHLAIAFAACSLFSAPASAALDDVTSAVSITRAPLVYNRATRTFDATVTLRNIGSQTLGAPLFLVVSGLPETVSVNSATSLSAEGQPMVNMPLAAAGLAPGQSISNFVVRFHNPAQVKFSPALKVLSHSGTALPPDPGAAGKLTLAGVDVNRNNVRDDVEIYIATNFTSSQKLRQALTDFAVASQRAILATNEQESMQAANLAGRAMECLEYVAPDDMSWQSVNAVAVNTPQRFAAWMAHQGRLAGSVLPGRPMREWRTSCTFQPDALNN